MTVGPRLSGSEVARLLGTWHRDGPAYAALAGALRSRVLAGALPLRSRLPSERELAAALGVSRTTATAAYDVLRADGYLESRVGSGSRVALPTGGTVDRELDVEVPEPRAADIDLTVAALPAPGAMPEAVAWAVEELAAYLGGTGYDPLGLPAMRRAVAGHHADRGLPTDERQVIVTSGAQHALALLLEALVAPGDLVLAESPGYPNAFEAMRRAGARVRTVPMTRAGWDLDRLAAGLARLRPRLAYLIPDFHNPTGFLMGEEARTRLAGAAGRAGTALVVDETFAPLDLEPWRRAPAPAAAFGDGTVISIGSMSKAFWGGLRVGWIRCAPALARRLARARAALDLATPVLDQLVAARLLGSSGAVLAERRELLRDRRDALVAAVRAELPGWSFDVPRGGMCLWARLDRPLARSLAEAAGAEGLRVVPGPAFGPGDDLEDRMRLPFTQPPDVLTEAATRLAAAERRLRPRPA